MNIKAKLKKITRATSALISALMMVSGLTPTITASNNDGQESSIKLTINDPIAELTDPSQTFTENGILIDHRSGDLVFGLFASEDAYEERDLIGYFSTSVDIDETVTIIEGEYYARFIPISKYEENLTSEFGYTLIVDDESGCVLLVLFPSYENANTVTSDAFTGLASLEDIAIGYWYINSDATEVISLSDRATYYMTLLPQQADRASRLLDSLLFGRATHRDNLDSGIEIFEESLVSDASDDAGWEDDELFFSNDEDVSELPTDRRHPGLTANEALRTDYLAGNVQHLTVGDDGKSLYYDLEPFAVPTDPEDTFNIDELVALWDLGIHPDARQIAPAPINIDHFDNNLVNVVNAQDHQVWQRFRVRFDGDWVIAFCGERFLPAPVNNSIFTPVESRNEDIRRTLFFAADLFGRDGFANRDFTNDEALAVTLVLTWFNGYGANTARNYRNSPSFNVITPSGNIVTSHSVTDPRGFGIPLITQLYDRVMSNEEIPARNLFRAFRLRTTDSFQDLFTGYIADTGYVQVRKNTNSQSIVATNPNYSLKGTVIGAWTSRAAAAEGGSSGRLGRFITDENGIGHLFTGTIANPNFTGYTRLYALSGTTVYVREIQAPAGHLLNDTIQEVVIGIDAVTTVTITNEILLGAIGVEKESAGDPAFVNNNPLYRLQGAVYGVWSTQSEAASMNSNTRIGTMTTNASGMATMQNMPLGVYYIREITPSAGHTLDPNIHRVQVTANNHATTQRARSVQPLPSAPLMLKLQKVDAEGARPAQGEASLAGAQYTVKYFPNTSATGAALRTWVFETDVNGLINFLDPTFLITELSDPVFLGHPYPIVFPLGTITIQETKAPKGYLLDPTVFVGHIEQDPNDHSQSIFRWADGANGALMVYNEADGIRHYEQVIRSDIQIKKQNAELRLSEGMAGLGSLAGIVYEIRNDSTHPIFYRPYGGRMRLVQPGEIFTTITTAWNPKTNTYTAQTRGQTVDGRYFGALSYGVYSIREVGHRDGWGVYRANEAYHATDRSWHTFEVREHRDTEADPFVMVTNNGNPLVWYNYILRNDFQLIKTAESFATRMSVPWALTNMITGETQIFITDRNGEFSSERSELHNRNNDNTRIMEGILGVGEGEITEQMIIDFIHGEAGHRLNMSDFYEFAGVWFGRGEFGSQAPQRDDLRALTFGDYVLRELPSDTNAPNDLHQGYHLQEFRFSVFRDDHVINLGTMTNWEVHMWSEAEDTRTGSQIAMAQPDTMITDVIWYRGLRSGEEYLVIGYIIDQETNQMLMMDGEVITAEATIRPISTIIPRSIRLTFRFDASQLAGRTIVFAADVFNSEGQLVARHRDVDDLDQTIWFPKIRTKLVDEATGNDLIEADGYVTLIDYVWFYNLIPGREYTVVGNLMDRDNGGHFIGPVAYTFIPAAPTGYVRIPFTFYAGDLGGRTLVAFERLYYRGSLIGSHEDLACDYQTVWFIEAEAPELTPPEVSEASVPPRSAPPTGLDSNSTLYLAVGVVTTTLISSCVVYQRKYKGKKRR